MHVLHVETGRQLYGGGRQVVHLVRGLAERRVHNTLACASGGALETEARATGADVVALPVAGELDPRLLLGLTETLKRCGADLVHVHSRRGADTLGALAARMSGVPLVISRRVDNPAAPLIGRWAYGWAQRIVAISQAVHDQLRRDGVLADKLRLVRSAVAVDDCRPGCTETQFRAMFGLAPNERTVAVVAQMIPRKGHAGLLELMPRVLASQPDLRLLLFGAGALESRLRQQVARLGFPERVVFAGLRPDLLSFLGHIDVLVHPARREGLGVALLEAQAAGVPVVAYATAGVAEAVSDRMTGLLVPEGDADALASAILSLLADRDLANRLGRAGSAWVAEQFSVAQMVDGNLAVYEELLAQERV